MARRTSAGRTRLRRNRRRMSGIGTSCPPSLTRWATRSMQTTGEGTLMKELRPSPLTLRERTPAMWTAPLPIRGAGSLTPGRTSTVVLFSTRASSLWPASPGALLGSPRRVRLVRHHFADTTSESCGSLLASVIANLCQALPRLAINAPLACDPARPQEPLHLLILHPSSVLGWAA
jgi:hypothetical protein